MLFPGGNDVVCEKAQGNQAAHGGPRRAPQLLVIQADASGQANQAAQQGIEKNRPDEQGGRSLSPRVAASASRMVIGVMKMEAKPWWRTTRVSTR